MAQVSNSCKNSVIKITLTKKTFKVSETLKVFKDQDNKTPDFSEVACL